MPDTPSSTSAAPPAEAASRSRCAVSGCEQPYHARGHCRRHWERAHHGRELVISGERFVRGDGVERDLHGGLWVHGYFLDPESRSAAEVALRAAAYRRQEVTDEERLLLVAMMPERLRPLLAKLLCAPELAEAA